MEDKILINDIVSQCLKYFEDNCYTKCRIARYKEYWRKGIIPFLQEHGSEFLTDNLAQAYLETCTHDGSVRHQEREMMRSVQVLVELWHIGKISRRYYTPAKHELTGQIGRAMEKFMAHLRNLRRGKSTLASYQLYLHDFLYFLQNNNVMQLSEISEWHVVRYAKAQKESRVNKVSALRMLFKYWKSMGAIGYDLEETFAGAAIKRHERTPSFYSTEEVWQIEDSIDRRNAVGKRDYAFFMLASRLGLRASDIALIEFSNIDWEHSTIHIIQDKTKVPIELPLLAEVGNAIIDYLRHGRRKSGLSRVFLSARAPFRPMSGSNVSSAIGRLILNSGVDTTGRHHGPHAMRHSLAATLLENGTSIPVISETLGHKSTETTMVYLKIDLTSLQKCALPVPSVPDSFYMQKGGVFYE